MKLYRFRHSGFARKVQMLLDLLGRSYELVVSGDPVSVTRTVRPGGDRRDQVFVPFKLYHCEHRSLPSTEVTVTNAGFAAVSVV